MIGHIYINGQIGSEYDAEGKLISKGVELIDVISAVKKQQDAESFEVHIESDGGSCKVGYDIYHFLRSLSKPIKTIASNRVASMGTVIFMAGDQREVTPNTEVMVHNPWGTVQGDASDIQAYADILLEEQQKAISFYCDVLNLTEEAVSPLLRDETFIRDEEQLLSLGIITGIQQQTNAYAKYTPKTMTNEALKEIKSMIRASLKAFGFKAKMIADATGTMLEITNADGSDIDGAPMEGNMVMVEGQPAEGAYTLPDFNITIQVAGGIIMSIEDVMPVAQNQDEEIARLKQELADAQSKLKEHEDNDSIVKAEMVSLQEKLKAMTMNDEPVKTPVASFRKDKDKSPREQMQERKSQYKKN